MQVTETLNQGLKREFKVVVPASELDNRLVERLNSLKEEVNIKGFRPGKVPPKIVLIDFKTISVERPTIEVADAEVDDQLKRLADSTRSYTTKSGKAAEGDRVTVAYVGKIDGEPFENGSDDNAVIRIGDKTFIPGFEEQLVNLSTDDTATINVTFPADYWVTTLAGKAATFDVTVKAVASADDVAIDDKLAERLGLESLQSLPNYQVDTTSTTDRRAATTHEALLCLARPIP